MHRSITPDTLAIASFNPVRGVITNFESATSETVSGVLTGDPRYVAPEMLMPLPTPQEDDELPTPMYTNAVDVWGLGMSFIELKNKKHIIEEEIEILASEKTHEQVLTMLSKWQLDEKYKSFSELVQPMISWDHRTRATSQQARDAAVKMDKEWHPDQMPKPCELSENKGKSKRTWDSSHAESSNGSTESRPLKFIIHGVPTEPNNKP